MHAFRTAIESRDIDAAVALLADDVEFRSPAVFTPYRGKTAAGTLLHAVFHVFEDFEYVREIAAPGSDEYALVFRARVGDKSVEGVDLLHVDSDGLIDDFAVMIRPMKGLLALAEAMQARLQSSDPNR